MWSRRSKPKPKPNVKQPSLRLIKPCKICVRSNENIYPFVHCCTCVLVCMITSDICSACKQLLPSGTRNTIAAKRADGQSNCRLLLLFVGLLASIGDGARRWQPLLRRDCDLAYAKQVPSDILTGMIDNWSSVSERVGQPAASVRGSLIFIMSAVATVQQFDCSWWMKIIVARSGAVAYRLNNAGNLGSVCEVAAYCQRHSWHHRTHLVSDLIRVRWCPKRENRTMS